MQFLIVIFLIFGFSLVASSLTVQPSSSARKAVLARAEKKATLWQSAHTAIARKILPLIHLEEIKWQERKQDLSTLGRLESPELFQATAWAKGLLYGGCFLWLVFFSPYLLIIPAIITIAGKESVESSLQTQLKDRREAIERELAQFAGTVQESLTYTRNVEEILRSYQKIAGPVLKSEIAHTLNDMRTGNHERAIEHLSVRINSGQFTQLAQGLISLLRGEDQRAYFRMLAHEYGILQDELIDQEIEKRPGKLFPYNMALFAGLFAMLIIALGKYLMDMLAQMV